MGFTGAGTYDIWAFQAPNLSLNSWGGNLEPGAVIKTHQRSTPPTENAKWQVALVAGSGDSAEYLIINSLTGYFITATGDNTIVSTPRISPNDPSARWTIKSMRTGQYDVYTITSKVSSRGQLTVKDSSNQQGADVLSAPKQDADNQKWYFEPQQ
ncbi:carbohydrate-binding module family 13 protein [Xylariaceae sp. AK1471]|nr:carbohydrate-binding module family 13 protein [Xylariaceae sp. AK1471]